MHKSHQIINCLIILCILVLEIKGKRAFPERPSVKIPEMYNYLYYLFQNTKFTKIYEYKTDYCTYKISNILPIMYIPNHYFPLSDKQITLRDRKVNFIFDLTLISTNIYNEYELSSIEYQNLYAEQIYSIIDFTVEPDHSLSFGLVQQDLSFYLSYVDLFSFTNNAKFRDNFNSRVDEVSTLFQKILSDFIYSVVKIYPPSNMQYYFEKINKKLTGYGYFDVNYFLGDSKYLSEMKFKSITYEEHSKISLGKSIFEKVNVNIIYSIATDELKSNSQFYHGEIDIRELLFSEENVDFIEAKISGPSPIYNIFVEKFKEEYEKNIILK